jgi:hypothetical protein
MESQRKYVSTCMVKEAAEWPGKEALPTGHAKLRVTHEGAWRRLTGPWIVWLGVRRPPLAQRAAVLRVACYGADTLPATAPPGLGQLRRLWYMSLLGPEWRKVWGTNSKRLVAEMSCGDFFPAASNPLRGRSPKMRSGGARLVGSFTMPDSDAGQRLSVTTVSSCRPFFVEAALEGAEEVRRGKMLRPGAAAGEGDVIDEDVDHLTWAAARVESDDHGCRGTRLISVQKFKGDL